MNGNARIRVHRQDELRQKIARGELPTTALAKAPRSVRNTLAEFEDKYGEGCIILGTTPETYDALGVPDANGRKDAGWLVHELVRRVPEAEREVKPNLAPPGGTTKHTWCILSREGRRMLVAEAQGTTVGALDSAVRVRSAQSIRRAAMDELLAQGLHECPTCFSPILDTNDPQYVEKDALIQCIGKHGAVLTRCGCGHGLCASE